MLMAKAAQRSRNVRTKLRPLDVVEKSVILAREVSVESIGWKPDCRKV